CRGCDLLAPLVEGGLVAGQPTRPQPVNQDTDTIGRARRIVDPAHLHRRPAHLPLLLHRTSITLIIYYGRGKKGRWVKPRPAANVADRQQVASIELTGRGSAHWRGRWESIGVRPFRHGRLGDDGVDGAVCASGRR